MHCDTERPRCATHASAPVRQWRATTRTFGGTSVNSGDRIVRIRILQHGSGQSILALAEVEEDHGNHPNNL